MFKKLSIAGAAVAAVLSAGSAFAINPTGPFAVTLTISGASAFQSAVEGELANTTNICQAGSFNKFQSTNNDFRAYTCTLSAGVIGAGGEAAAIYYRGEGGSVFALAPLLTGARFNGAAIPQPKRLLLSNCPNPGSFGTLTAVPCTTGLLNLATESNAAVAGLENATSQVGFADIEPALFFGENYPGAAAIPILQPALSAAERNTLNTSAEPVVGQSFGVFVGSGVPADSLSKTVLANIFQGTYADWSSVPGSNTATVTTASLPIKLCRREQGSGTQVAASIFFNDYTNTSAAFASEANPGNLAVGLGGGGVVENNATSAMRNCISGNSGAIGLISVEDNALPGRRMIKIDNQPAVLPAFNNTGPATAAGQYAFWYEEVVLRGPALTGAAATLANKLIPALRVQASGPITPNVTFLSSFNGSGLQFPPVTPANKQPISCVRRNKVSTGSIVWQC